MNQIKVSIQQSIIGLTARGWSRRRIARELQVDRATVGRQLRRTAAEANAATNPILGSEGAYLIYSAVLGSGDLAVVFNATTWHWRPWIGTSGIVAYSAAVLLSRSGLRRLIGTGVLDTATASRCCSISYWWGAAVVTAGAVFNPVSHLLILTSGAAVGFGAMVGLLVLPPSLPSTAEGEMPVGSLRIDCSWVVAGAISAALFIGVLGPGIRLAK